MVEIFQELVNIIPEVKATDYYKEHPKDFEKVYLIAENVSIDALGNIDTINEKIIKLT